MEIDPDLYDDLMSIVTYARAAAYRVHGDIYRLADKTMDRLDDLWTSTSED